MEINKITIKQFETEALSVLSELAKKYKVKLAFGGGTYDDNKFTSQLKVENLTSNGITAETQKALNELPWFNEIYNKSFKEGKHSFKVVGYHFYKTYPIDCIRDDGKQFSFKTSIINTKEFF